MTKREVPAPSLKRAQNGSIGEARSRGFLLNRFWVLERSPLRGDVVHRNDAAHLCAA